MPGVFVHRRDTHYDDQPDVRYQFPSTYLSRARQFERDWVVYYEPVKAGARGFYAIGFVERIIQDPSNLKMYIAEIEPGTYLDFATPVPHRIDGQLVESGLSNAQAAVRPLSHADFIAITDLGLGTDDNVLPRADPTDVIENLVREDQSPFMF